jgi:flagellar biosynthesis/type III secretory pathway M-ring protein FliF/YscJ
MTFLYMKMPKWLIIIFLISISIIELIIFRSFIDSLTKNNIILMFQTLLLGTLMMIGIYIVILLGFGFLIFLLIKRLLKNNSKK